MRFFDSNGAGGYSVAMRRTAYISLGGNMGDVPATFGKALAVLEKEQGIHVDARSSLYRTEPQGDTDQPWFYNQVARLCCDETVTPERLLDVLQDVENSLGRKRDPARRFGPRPIDLDIILFDSFVRAGKHLTIPHPRMRERAFILVPLAEIAPELRLPCGTAIREILAALDYSVKDEDIYQPVR